MTKEELSEFDKDTATVIHIIGKWGTRPKFMSELKALVDDTTDAIKEMYGRLVLPKKDFRAALWNTYMSRIIIQNVVIIHKSNMKELTKLYLNWEKKNDVKLDKKNPALKLVDTKTIN